MATETHSTWVSARDAASDREPRPDENETVEHVHQLVTAWMHGEIPTSEVRLMSSGHERWTATRFTDPQHRLFRPMMDLLDNLIATENSEQDGRVYDTKHGMFSEAMLRWARAEIGKVGDELRILFPVREPWERRPDPQGMTREAREGRRSDHPTYARTSDERWRWANERDAPPPARKSVFD